MPAGRRRRWHDELGRRWPRHPRDYRRVRERPAARPGRRLARPRGLGWP